VTRQEAIYLEDIVDDSVRAVRSVAEQGGVAIELGALVEARTRGDSDLLGRLLLNLLDNAIKFSEPGGTVDVAMSREDGCCVITVGDRGIGIPPEAKDQIFEPFFRADRTRSHAEAAATGGAGLGLAIARRIASLHDGRLELVESRPGRTVFRLTLPVEELPAQ
jgi:signal transduction histidine kinase